MSEHCQHCEGCREGFGYDREGLAYDGWAHHCFIDGAGYLHWDEGRCPLCATAQLERAKERWWRAWDNGHACGVECGSKDERAAIVAWLSKPGLFLSGVAEVIERGEHLRDDDE